MNKFEVFKRTKKQNFNQKQTQLSKLNSTKQSSKMYSKITAIAFLAAGIEASRTNLGHAAPLKASRNKRSADPEFQQYMARHNKHCATDEEL